MRYHGSRLRAASLTTTALAAAVASLLGPFAATAGAADGASWPAAGYAPTCDSQQALSGGRTRYQDDTPPAVGTVTFAKGRTQVVARPGGTQTSFVSRLTDPCSGVDAVVLDLYLGRGFVRAVPLVPDVVGGHAFYVTGRSAVTTVQVHEVGRYSFAGGISRQRYSSFVLDSGDHLVSSVAQQDWSLVSNPRQDLLVLKGTRLTDAAARRATGADRFRLSAALQVATDKAWVALPGTTVQLQRRTAGGWVVVRTVVAGGRGGVKAVVRATSATRFRFGLAEATGRLRAGSHSRALRVG
jgi:hypothetical protein